MNRQSSCGTADPPQRACESIPRQIRVVRFRKSDETRGADRDRAAHPASGNSSSDDSQERSYATTSIAARRGGAARRLVSRADALSCRCRLRAGCARGAVRQRFIPFSRWMAAGRVISWNPELGREAQ